MNYFYEIFSRGKGKNSCGVTLGRFLHIPPVGKFWKKKEQDMLDITGDRSVLLVVLMRFVVSCFEVLVP